MHKQYIAAFDESNNGCSHKAPFEVHVGVLHEYKPDLYRHFPEKIRGPKSIPAVLCGAKYMHVVAPKTEKEKFTDERAFRSAIYASMLDKWSSYLPHIRSIEIYGYQEQNLQVDVINNLQMLLYESDITHIPQIRVSPHLDLMNVPVRKADGVARFLKNYYCEISDIMQPSKYEKTRLRPDFDAYVRLQKVLRNVQN